MIEFKLKGGKEVHTLLQQLPVEVETKILRAALAQGAKVIAQDAEQRAPVEYGALRAAIKTSRDTNRKTGQVVAKVKLKGPHAFLGIFFEYGVVPHIITARQPDGSLKIGDRYVGHEVEHPGVPAQPFMRPAAEARAQDAINVVGDYLHKYLRFGSISVPEVSVDLEGE